MTRSHHNSIRLFKLSVLRCYTRPTCLMSSVRSCSLGQFSINMTQKRWGSITWVTQTSTYPHSGGLIFEKYIPLPTPSGRLRGFPGTEVGGIRSLRVSTGTETFPLVFERSCSWSKGKTKQITKNYTKQCLTELWVQYHYSENINVLQLNYKKTLLKYSQQQP